MLYEIYCEQFHKKRINFNENLNVVLGTDEGYNSIGKSTFLLIVDFVFGGKTYSHAEDIIKNIGSHDIYFTFKFDDVLYKFCRNNTKSQEVWKCDDDYNKIESLALRDFCEWLDKMYEMQLMDLSFRDAVGRYIRVYGKGNYNEKQPLHYLPNEKGEKVIFNLLKLFDLYSSIKDIQEQAISLSEQWKVLNAAQKLNFISKITKKEYEENNKKIEVIIEKLKGFTKLFENQIIGNNLLASEEALQYKNLLSNARRKQGSLKTRYKIISDNQEYKFSLTSDTYKELNRYFPNVALANIEKVECFHNKIAEIFKSELLEEKNKLYKDIQKCDESIKFYENKLRELLNDKDIPRKILQQHAVLLKELDTLKKQNYAYGKKEELKENKKESVELLNDLKIKQFSIIQDKINVKMKSFNDYIYSGTYKAPLLSLRNSGYDFFTPDDTGTGIAYKGLIIFDLAILALTKLPILVHDSLILKQIYDNAIEKILELYIQSNKQVIIAFDKQNSYTRITKEILKENTVLKLGPDGKELFGRSWR